MNSLFKGNKKGQSFFDNFRELFLALGAIVIIVAIVFLVMAQTKSQIVSVEGINETNSSTFTVAYNATNTLIQATEDVPGWIPLVVIVVIGTGMFLLVRRGFG